MLRLTEERTANTLHLRAVARVLSRKGSGESAGVNGSATSVVVRKTIC
jgi:hypothetical protein